MPDIVRTPRLPVWSAYRLVTSAGGDDHFRRLGSVEAEFESQAARLATLLEDATGAVTLCRAQAGTVPLLTLADLPAAAKPEPVVVAISRRRKREALAEQALAHGRGIAA